MGCCCWDRISFAYISSIILVTICKYSRWHELHAVNTVAFSWNVVDNTRRMRVQRGLKRPQAFDFSLHSSRPHRYFCPPLTGKLSFPAVTLALAKWKRRWGRRREVKGFFSLIFCPSASKTNHFAAGTLYFSFECCWRELERSASSSCYGIFSLSLLRERETGRCVDRYMGETDTCPVRFRPRVARSNTTVCSDKVRDIDRRGVSPPLITGLRLKQWYSNSKPNIFLRPGRPVTRRFILTPFKKKKKEIVFIFSWVFWNSDRGPHLTFRMYWIEKTFCFTFKRE